MEECQRQNVDNENDTNDVQYQKITTAIDFVNNVRFS